jgi:glycosyltransferase involved in cell wall biosynthesis
MRVVVALDFRFLQTPDGSVWTDTVYEWSFWRRYLDVFDGVLIVARTLPAASVESGWQRVDGDRVSFQPVPHYLGPWQYLLRSRAVRSAAENAVTAADAVILRAPAQVSNCVAAAIIGSGRPFGMEVGGDPASAFRAGVAQHPLRAFFQWWFTERLRRQCRHASAAAYVAAFLETLYPSNGRAFQVSDVDLPPDAFLAPTSVMDKLRAPRTRPFTLITVAALARMYKGIDVLLDALAQCPGVSLRIVGDGVCRAELEARARSLSLADRVTFLGQLPAGEAVRQELDQADLFVLPSRTEGLPRAMLEAMARGLPCLGSDVGGIPELLSAEDLVPAGDPASLAARIREVGADETCLTRMAVRNLEKSAEYRDTALRPRRRAFYEYLRERTETWRNGRAALCVSSTS